MGAFQDRMDRAMDEYQEQVHDAHDRGEHKDNIDHDCGACHPEAREAMNREGDPAFNGAFDKW